MQLLVNTYWRYLLLHLFEIRLWLLPLGVSLPILRRRHDCSCSALRPHRPRPQLGLVAWFAFIFLPFCAFVNIGSTFSPCVPYWRTNIIFCPASPSYLEHMWSFTRKVYFPSFPFPFALQKPLPPEFLKLLSYYSADRLQINRLWILYSDFLTEIGSVIFLGPTRCLELELKKDHGKIVNDSTINQKMLVLSGYKNYDFRMLKIFSASKGLVKVINYSGNLFWS